MKLKTSKGAFEGRSADSIIRREFGRGAYLRYSADRNNPDMGLIVKDAPKMGSGWSAHVLAVAYWAS